LKDYGVWYDALRIATELVVENPDDPNAKAYHSSLIRNCKTRRRRKLRKTSSGLPLWQKLRPLLTKGDEAGAHALIKQQPEAAARSLYRELLFENATAKIYENPTLPFSEAARQLLADVDDKTRALESHFAQWSQEKKLDVGFTAAGEPVEQMIYLAQVANLRSGEKDPGKDAPPGTPRELSERAQELADANGIELASASFSLSLSVYALREKRLDDIPAPLGRAEPIAVKWEHPVALFQIPFIRGYAAYAAENWKDAAIQFARAAELAKAMPGLRRWRVNALSMLATVARNTGDKATVHTALAAAVEEQPQVLSEATGDEARLKESKQLANLQTQLGGAFGSTGPPR
jgi:hypothetical protein